MIRFAIAFAALIFIAASGTAEAQQNCNSLHLITTLHLTQIPGDSRTVAPFTINGMEEHFLFDTGGSLTQIKNASAKSLQLIVQPGNIRMYDARGRMSNDMASVPDFSLGTMHGSHGFMPVTPNENAAHADPFDGILALDYLRRNDIEVDFGTDTLNIISPDHCPGRVTYWSPPVVAIVSFQKSQDQQQIVVPVTLDGQELTALIDTGASQTSMRIDIAESKYNLTLGATDTPENKFGLNGDAALKTYHHTFGTLSFGDVAVTNPPVMIFPNAMGNVNDRWGQVTRMAHTDIVNAPQLIIGMDVLRKLRIYMAFGEGKLYVTPASAPASAPAAKP